MKRIAVAGGTGWTGKLVVSILRETGHEVIVLARSTGADLTDGSGLANRLDGVDTVIDVTNVDTLNARKATAFFETVTRTLLHAEEAAGVTHHVVLSIVGVDQVDTGYYLGKRRQEALASSGPVPCTILRATQFHEFAAQMLDRGGWVVPAPRMLTQPVAVVEVAHRLAEIAAGEPLSAAEIAGPQQLWMQDMIKRLARHRGDRRPVLPITVPGKAGRQLRSGRLLPGADVPRGSITFDQWLAAQLP
jgi:uncharacterized protein YbjT (DUF2867 family)